LIYDDNVLILTLLIIGLLVVVVLIVAVAVAARTVIPLDYLGKVCEEKSEGEGDPTIQLKISKISEIDRIPGGFNSFIRQIHEIISQVKINADSLSSASQELSVITSDNSEKTTQ
jgi:methyl-accepting chemotaxis protein